MARTKAELDLLREVADLEGTPKGAYNIRKNGKLDSRNSTENIQIVTKEDKPGIDIYIKPGTKRQSVHIPVIITETGLDELVYNDFHIGADCDVVIVAGCGVHTSNGEPARHNGIHRFFLGKGSRVKYLEKHVGLGQGFGLRSIDPVTEAYLDEDSVLEMDTSQIGGVDRTKRITRGEVGKNAKLLIRERLFTEKEQIARTDFEVTLSGENAGVDLISRSVARGKSHQEYRSAIVGDAPCTGHSECDAIIAEEASVDAAPELKAHHPDASLIHEAAIGKIAGEQILKLRTLGLTEAEAEAKIIEGFLN